MNVKEVFRIAFYLACFALLYTEPIIETACGDQSAVQAPDSQGADVPAFAGNVTPEQWSQYSAWVETLPEDQKDWERLLQENLGPGFYFPIYLKSRLAARYTKENPGDWGFVFDDPALPRILLIGDSISRSYTEGVRKRLGGIANVHRAPANCGSAATILSKFNDWQPATVKNQTKRWDVIYCNAGIHDRSGGSEKYRENLKKLAELLNKQGAVVIWASTTPCMNDENGLEVCRQFNQIAEEVMRDNQISVDDLFSVVIDDIANLQAADKVHYNSAGIEKLADRAAQTLKKTVEDLNAQTAQYQPCPTPQRITRQEWIDYMKLVKSLPPEQQKWEQLHIKYEGYHGLLWYIIPRTKGAYTPENPGIWGQLTDDPSLPRVLIIGDSISLGYTIPVREALKGKANVHRPPCNCGPTTSILNGLDDWLGDGKWDVIHINAGLHDRRRTDDQYRENLQKIIDRLKKTGATIIWANTTPCTNEEDLIGRVETFNKIAAEVMAANDVAVDDFYALLQPRYEELVGKDKCHYTAAGSAIMAKATTEAIEKALASCPRD